MKTYLDCVPCFLRQTLEVLRATVEDDSVRQEVMSQVLSALADFDLRRSPPVMSCHIHRLIRRITGCDDPYLEAKRRSNRLALDLYPQLKRQIESSPDPWETGLRLAIAGNIIDLGFKSEVKRSDVARSIEQSLAQPLPGEAVAGLRRAVAGAGSILYIGDNAGEVVFDRLFIEQMPLDRITFAVRGRPIINDATLEDARAAGLTELVEVIDDGSDAPGTLLEECSPAFAQQYKQADLIIAKGQGNYETLSDANKHICYLFKVKCPVVARDAGVGLDQIAVVWKKQA